MHGVIFAELRKYADARLGAEAWNRLLVAAGLTSRLYLPIKAYPDAEAAALVQAAAAETGLTADAVLQDFGEFIAPDLLRLYGSLLDPAWTTLDVIEHTEETIHRVVRMRNPGAEPPELRCERTGPDDVVIHYASARRMCGVAKGIARGLARNFGETVEVGESQCMTRGAPECLLTVTRKA